MKKITKFEKEQCKKCKYRTKLETEIICNYLEITKNRRPSPVGEPCKEFEEGKALIKKKFATKAVRGKHRATKYCDLTEEQKQIRREATRRYKEKQKLLKQKGVVND